MKGAKLPVLSLLFLFVTHLHSQTPINLEPGNTYSKSLEPGISHTYQVKLNKDDYAFLEVRQTGIDAVIHVIEPDGNLLERIDQNGKFANEHIILTPKQSGTYNLEIHPYGTTKKKGEYSITYNLKETRATTLKGKVAQLMKPYSRPGNPGAAISVVKNGKMIFSEGFGSANLEYDIPITPQTIFHIASISKQFTVMAALLLKQEGKLNMDDDIRKYLPNLPDYEKPITLRHLATHTSGLRDQWDLLAMAGWRLDDVITTEQIFKLLHRQEGINFNPGEEHLYSNTGFTLLAKIIENVSGQTLREFTRQHIFDPLEMSNTFFYDDHEEIVRNRAYSYQPDSLGYSKSVLNYATVGPSSLFTTVEDLSKWVKNFNDPQVGNVSILKTMSAPAILNDSSTTKAAMGQYVSDYKGLQVISHGGADAGYRAYLMRFPEYEAAVIVLSNYSRIGPRQLAYKVADIFFSEYLSEEEVKEESGLDVTISEDLLENIPGTYKIEYGPQLEIQVDNGTATAKIIDGPTFELVPVSSNSFQLKDTEVRAEFKLTEEQNFELFIHNDGQVERAQQLPPFNPESVDLTQYEGRYHSHELETHYNILVQNNELIVRHPRHSDIPLTPIADDEFKGQWPFVSVKFADNSSIMTVTSGRVRDLEFMKE